MTTPQQSSPTQTAGAIAPSGAPTMFAAAESVWPRVLLALLMALLFYLPNNAQIPIQIGIRGLNVANILFLMALFALWMMPPQKAEPIPLKGPLFLFFGLLTWALGLALAGDSTAWVEDVTFFKNAIFYILLYFMYYYAVRDMKTVRILVLLILFVMFTSSVLGVRQALDYGIATFNENKRVAAPFGWSVFNANRAAVFMVIYLQLVLAVVFFLKSHKWLRLACLGIFGMGVFAIFHTYSRQVYIILAVLLLLVALRKHLMMAVVASLMLLNYDLWVPETVVQRIEMTQVDQHPVKPPQILPPAYDAAPVSNSPLYSDMHEYRASLFVPVVPIQQAPEQTSSERDRQYDESTESRFILWAGAGEIIAERPLGIGFNRFKREITPYVPPGLAGKDAHNYYVLLTTEAGVLAPLVLLIVFVSLLVLGNRLASMSDDEECRTLGIGFVMATLAVMMGNIYGSRFVDGDVMGIYWIMAALVARTIQFKRAERLLRAQQDKVGAVRTPAASVPVALAPTSAARPGLAPQVRSGPSRFF
jgi:hypothetical protein